MTQIPTSILMKTVRRYFTNSCKIFTTFTTITNDHTDGLWPSVFYRDLQNIYCPCHNHQHCFWQTNCRYIIIEARATIRVLGRSVRIPTDAANSNVRALTPLYQQTCRWTSKILDGFLNFSAKFKIYQRKFNATTMKILF
jgi:hypothetical protein